jgi:hypothetical protein
VVVAGLVGCVPASDGGFASGGEWQDRAVAETPGGQKVGAPLLTNGLPRLVPMDPADAADDAESGTDDPQEVGPEDDGCTRTRGWWLTHPGRWADVELTLGDRDYGQAALIELMAAPPGEDASLWLAAQVVAAELSIEAGVSGADVESVLEVAHERIAAEDDGQGLPLGISARSEWGAEAMELGRLLLDWNDGTCGATG